METRYYMQNGHYMKLDVEQDDVWINPREEFDHISELYAWNRDFYRWYSIGDMTKSKDMWEELYDLISDRMTVNQVIQYVKSGKTELSVKYDRHCREWDLTCGTEYISSAHDLEWLYDDMIAYMTFREINNMLDKAGVLLVPLDVADYGCNGLRISEAWNERDGLLCGFQMISKQSVVGCFGDDQEWKAHAYQIMEEELREFDLYLQGLVYYAKWSEYDWNERDFHEIDSIGGIYSDLYGDDLFRFIAETNHEMFEDFNDLYRHVA